MALSSAEAYAKLKAEATELLNDTGQALACLLDAPASESHADAHIDLTQQLGAFFGCYYKLRKRLERDCLSVAVLALTKSGKSSGMVPALHAYYQGQRGTRWLSAFAICTLGLLSNNVRSRRSLRSCFNKDLSLLVPS